MGGGFPAATLVEKDGAVVGGVEVSSALELIELSNVMEATVIYS